MKKIYLLTTCMLFLFTFLCSTSVQSQELVVGYLNNGNAAVSSIANATTVLKGGLAASVSVTDIYIDKEPESGKYFLIGTIRNGKISGKAIELQLEGNTLRAIGGPGLEITCTGKNCNECVPIVQNWKARCACKDNPASPNSQCDMTSKIVITPW